MLALELILLISGILSCVVSMWTPEIFERLPNFVQQLFVNNLGWGYLINVLKYASYLGILLLLVNLISGLKTWWWSRISVALSVVYFHYVWGKIF